VISYRLPGASRRVVEALVPIVCPDHPAPPAQHVLADFEESLASMPSALRAALVTGMLSYEYLAVAWPTVVPLPASRLSLVQGRRYFAAWWNSPLLLQREFARGVKGLLCLNYYEQPAVREFLGYTPKSWLKKVSTKRLSLYSDAISRHRESLFAPDPLPQWKKEKGASHA
jgi:hypothetical protein